MRIPSKAMLAAGVACASSAAHAGGFGLLLNSAAVQGNAFSSGGAAADASTVWYNPAGMAKLDGNRFTGNVSAVDTSFRYHDGGSTGAFANPGTGEGGDGGGRAYLPQLYGLTSPSERWRLGIAVNTPFGLKTEYDPGWRGQLVALKSEVQSINVNPAVAYKVDETWSVGAGVNWQRFKANLSSFAGPAGTATLDASDTGWGYNLGAMFSPSDATRIGLAYRSPIAYKLKGNATFSAGGGALDSGAQADVTVPESVSLTSFSAVSPDWEIAATATWTRWSRLQSFDVTRTSATTAGQAAGSTVTTIQFKWRSTTFVGLGANYNYSGEWKLRGGVAYDPAVSNDETRNPRLPDQSRWILGLGGRYSPSNTSYSLDLGYIHELIKTATVDNTVAGVPGALTGSFKSNADVLSVQYNQKF